MSDDWDHKMEKARDALFDFGSRAGLVVGGGLGVFYGFQAGGLGGLIIGVVLGLVAGWVVGGLIASIVGLVFDPGVQTWAVIVLFFALIAALWGVGK